MPKQRFAPGSATKMRFGRPVLIFAIGALSILLATMGIRLWNDLHNLSIADGDNLQWTILQLDTEMARLHATLLEEQAAQVPDSNTIRLRTNIALSRIQLVQEGNARSTFVEDASAIDLLERLNRFAADASLIIDSETRIAPENLQELLELTRDIRPVARRLALLGNSIGAQQAEDDRLALAGQLGLTGVIAIVTIAALTATLVILDRLLRIAAERDRQLRASSARLASTISASLDAIVTTDANGKIVDYNSAAEQILGWSRSEILGRNIQETIAPTPIEDEGAEAFTKPTLDDAAACFGEGRIEIRAKKRDGQLFPAEMNIASVKEHEAGLMIYYFHDISDRKINEQRLVMARDHAERMDRAKTRFLAIMSHEMRTPLNGILGLLDLMRSKNLTPEQDRYAQVAISSAEILLQQTNDALDIARIEAGSIEFSSQTFNLFEVLERTIELLEPLAVRKRLSLNLKVDPQLPETFVGDEDRIRQIITNLIGNGIKFTESGHVSVEVSGKCNGILTDVEISVSDTGAGIPESQHQAIFEDFVALSKPEKIAERGDGLGLSISRRIARLMGGELSVDSVLGEGSTFTLKIPLEPSAAPMQADDPKRYAASPKLSLDAPGRQVLVVEDNSISRTVLTEMLNMTGHRTTVAADGEEGIEAAMRQRFDLIIMDINLPKMNGLEATQHIRSHPGPNSDVPILGLTAYGSQEFRAKAKAAGMTDFATKPLRLGDLGALLDGVVDRSARDENAPVEPHRAAFDDLFRLLGDSRASEIAVKFRNEIRRTIGSLDGTGDPLSNEDLERELHNLRGAADLLGFPQAAERLDRLCDDCIGAAHLSSSAKIGDILIALNLLSKELEHGLAALNS